MSVKRAVEAVNLHSSWPGSSRPSTPGLAINKDVDARHNGPVLGPAKPDPSAGHDGGGMGFATNS